MFEFICELYGTVFTRDDLDQFVKVGWLTYEQAEQIWANGGHGSDDH